MKKSLFSILCFLTISSLVYAQNQIPDTILVKTVKNPVFHQKHYVLMGETEMIVYFGEEKNDTAYYSPLDAEILPYYQRALSIYNLRLKPVNKIDADEVFDYFPMGSSPEEVIRLLGNKKVSISDNTLEVVFYNHWHKKNEVFTFKFHEGQLYDISRPGTSTLPTSDLRTAFQLVELKSNLKQLEKVVEQLSK